MAQRVFLIQMPEKTLVRAAATIAGNAVQRSAIAAELSVGSAAHLRRVATSEAVIEASSRGTRDVSDDWMFARNCMPYLLAARSADEMEKLLDDVQRLDDARALEDFFVAQARALGMSPEGLDRQTFAAPETGSVEAWIGATLAKAADLRSKALQQRARSDDDDRDPIADYAVSTWIWLGQLFARTHPCFWQGRNRWLGGAAFPDVFTVRTTVTTLDPSTPTGLWARVRRWFGAAPEPRPSVSPELAALIETTRRRTEKQLASRSFQRLRGLLESTATLAPALSIPGWEEALPKEGSGSLASGAVRYERLPDLVAAMHELRAEEHPPYETTAEWSEIVIAAARCARRAGAHLVEGDDSIDGVYRWPAIDEA